MSILRMIYLALAIVGAVMPMRYFVRWFNDNSWSLGQMVEAWHVNDATRGLVWDLTVAAIALTVFIIAEVIARKDYWLLICIPAIYGVGVSFGLPLYLFLRSKPST